MSEHVTDQMVFRAIAEFSRKFPYYFGNHCDFLLMRAALEAALPARGPSIEAELLAALKGLLAMNACEDDCGRSECRAARAVVAKAEGRA